MKFQFLKDSSHVVIGLHSTSPGNYWYVYYQWEYGYYMNLGIVGNKSYHKISYKICGPSTYLFPERRGFHFE